MDAPPKPASRVSTIWRDLDRPLPDWFARAKLGIFIHWGPYSVPAWAEPTGELGAVPDDEWFAHNPYAEWYFNTIRIPGSPAARHHHQAHGGRPYDHFIDEWATPDFDPDSWARLFRDIGAQYVIPTTKHHDGVALWDAPGTGDRNTVRRGPRRDLVGEIATAVRRAGLRFGVYYSGGLDWSVTDLPPHTTHASVTATRPRDAAYNAYAYLHVNDLIERYRPDVLWNDIEWPDAGKRTGSYSLHELFRAYYAAVPEGVVNDRWGDTHADFRTSEYQHGLDNETAAVWENCRGIGYSFGYNQLEDEKQTLSGHRLARHLTDVVSRGGRFLLNIGPTASGRIPAVQRAALDELGRWMTEAGSLVHASMPVRRDVAQSSDEPWVRWLETPTALVAVVDHHGRIPLRFDGSGLATDAATLLAADGRVERTDDAVVVQIDELPAGPAVVSIPRR